VAGFSTKTVHFCSFYPVVDIVPRNEAGEGFIETPVDELL